MELDFWSRAARKLQFSLVSAKSFSDSEYYDFILLAPVIAYALCTPLENLGALSAIPRFHLESMSS